MNTPKKRTLGPCLGLIIPGGIVLFEALIIALLLYITNVDVRILLIAFAFFAVGMTLFILGMVKLSLYKEYRAYVLNNTKDTTCLITNVFSYKQYMGRYMRDRYVITVAYKSMNGNTLSKDVALNVYVWKELNTGMRIACKVYGDELFINPQKVDVVEEVEGE